MQIILLLKIKFKNYQKTQKSTKLSEKDLEFLKSSERNSMWRENDRKKFQNVKKCQKTQNVDQISR